MKYETLRANTFELLWDEYQDYLKKYPVAGYGTTVINIGKVLLNGPNTYWLQLSRNASSD
jgi:hypothetical protein